MKYEDVDGPICKAMKEGRPWISIEYGSQERGWTAGFKISKTGRKAYQYDNCDIEKILDLIKAAPENTYLKCYCRNAWKALDEAANGYDWQRLLRCISKSEYFEHKARNDD